MHWPRNLFAVVISEVFDKAGRDRGDDASPWPYAVWRRKCELELELENEKVSDRGRENKK